MLVVLFGSVNWSQTFILGEGVRTRLILCNAGLRKPPCSLVGSWVTLSVSFRYKNDIPSHKGDTRCPVLGGCVEKGKVGGGNRRPTGLA